jgi:multimeric flavodoxin WrbA
MKGKTMKVLGIAASPRTNSNTLQYVEKALSVLDKKGIETELISLRGKEIKSCTGCYECVDKGRCTIKGDDFDPIMEKMRTTQGLILGSPVYLSSVVPQMMALLARATFVSYWNDKFFTGKVGGPVTVARRAGHCMAFSQLLLWFFINGFTVPGSTYWNVGVAGASGARDAEKDEEGMSTVSNFAENMAALMRKVF